MALRVTQLTSVIGSGAVLRRNDVAVAVINQIIVVVLLLVTTVLAAGKA